MIPFSFRPGNSFSASRRELLFQFAGATFLSVGLEIFFKFVLE